MKGASDEDGIWKFFSRNYPYYYHKKIGFVWAPLQAFLDIRHFFGHFHFVNPGWKYFSKEFGS